MIFQTYDQFLSELSAIVHINGGKHIGAQHGKGASQYTLITPTGLVKSNRAFTDQSVLIDWNVGFSYDFGSDLDKIIEDEWNKFLSDNEFFRFLNVLIDDYRGTSNKVNFHRSSNSDVKVARGINQEYSRVPLTAAIEDDVIWFYPSHMFQSPRHYHNDWNNSLCIFGKPSVVRYITRILAEKFNLQTREVV